MLLTVTMAPLLLLMQSTTHEEEVFVFEGDDPFAKNVKMYRYHGSLDDAGPERTIVCRDVMEVGSKLPSRICRMLSKWQDIYAANQDDLEQKRRSKRGGTTKNSGSGKSS